MCVCTAVQCGGARCITCSSFSLYSSSKIRLYCDGPFTVCTPVPANKFAMACVTSFHGGASGGGTGWCSWRGHSSPAHTQCKRRPLQNQQYTCRGHIHTAQSDAKERAHANPVLNTIQGAKGACVCVRVCVRACVFDHPHTHTHTHTHTYTHTHTLPIRRGSNVVPLLW